MSGNNAQIRLGLETSEGVPGHDQDGIPFSTESLEMEYVPVDSKNIDPSGNRPATEILAAHGKGSIVSEVNSESFLRTRIHMNAVPRTGKAFFIQENQATGVERYTLRDYDPLTDTVETWHAGSMHAGVWRDEMENPTEYRALGMKAEKMTLAVKAGEFAVMTHDFLYLREAFSDNPAKIGGAAFAAGELFTDGLRAADDANGDEYNFKVPVGGGGVLGVAKLVFGKNGVYGTTEYVTASIMDIMNADDTLASGDLRLNYRLHITDDAIFVAGQEWKIEAVSGKPVPVTSTRPKLTGASALFEWTLGGVTKSRRIDEFTIEQYAPREAKPGIGSIFDQEIGYPQDSRRYWNVMFNSQYKNLEMKQALTFNRTFIVHVQLRGAYIGSTGLLDYVEYTFGDMRLNGGAGATIQNPGDNPENPKFTSAGATPCVEVIQNTVASVDPT